MLQETTSDYAKGENMLEIIISAFISAVLTAVIFSCLACRAIKATEEQLLEESKQLELERAKNKSLQDKNEDLSIILREVSDELIKLRNERKSDE